ncbi:cytochrome o ubiquinol oxidase subunit IV [Pseudochelatococcus contaminans]|uniref:Cytochrome bo(3) ubiquinol oxidase subunit 4 n=1 Tax=Pseudochelatococcus contaminans TaxID=1538103 RepID=A0A7W6EGT2_9HYPH|nr:cytochrome o ubiquinol oxidase subunit IV [Pseudochelatococcus contaminans]MBB3809643.1 cytochrome o ubiquinol oxidase operon protein cyoD [Pseudochelatococcus contaminans]
MGAKLPDAATAHSGAQHHSGEAHGTVGGYITGFILSAILTVIPFWLVMSGALADTALTALAVAALGALQIVVHMVYFLQMNGRSEAGWTLSAFIFTVIIIAIAVVGSVWVMHHLDVNMMPMTHEDARTLP